MESERSTSVHYEKVKAYAVKRGECVKCGYKAARHLTAIRVLDPGYPPNQDSSGNMKSAMQIKTEVAEEARLWEETPIFHQKCEEA